MTAWNTIREYSVTPLTWPPSSRENVVVITGWSDKRGFETKEMTGLSIQSVYKKVVLWRGSTEHPRLDFRHFLGSGFPPEHFPTAAGKNMERMYILVFVFYGLRNVTRDIFEGD